MTFSPSILRNVLWINLGTASIRGVSEMGQKPPQGKHFPYTQHLLSAKNALPILHLTDSRTAMNPLLGRCRRN